MTRNAAEALRKAIGRCQLARCIHKHTDNPATVDGLTATMNDSGRRALLAFRVRDPNASRDPALRSQLLVGRHGRPIGLFYPCTFAEVNTSLFL